MCEIIRLNFIFKNIKSKIIGQRQVAAKNFLRFFKLSFYQTVFQITRIHGTIGFYVNEETEDMKKKFHYRLTKIKNKRNSLNIST